LAKAYLDRLISKGYMEPGLGWNEKAVVYGLSEKGRLLLEMLDRVETELELLWPTGN